MFPICHEYYKTFIFDYYVNEACKIRSHLVHILFVHCTNVFVMVLTIFIIIFIIFFFKAVRIILQQMIPLSYMVLMLPKKKTIKFYEVFSNLTLFTYPVQSF